MGFLGPTVAAGLAIIYILLASLLPPSSGQVCCSDLVIGGCSISRHMVADMGELLSLPMFLILMFRSISIR